MKINNIAIVGLGALGTMYGKFFADAVGVENTYVIADKERIDRYRRDGILYNDEPCSFSYIDKSCKDKKFDLILFSTKGYHLAQAILDAGKFVGKDTVIISVLNGVTSENILAEKFGGEKVIYSIAQGMSAVRTGNNLCCHGMGTLVIGDGQNNDTPQMRRLVEFFERTGIAFQVSPDILHHLWGKLMLNVGCNQVTAAYDLTFAPIQKPGKYRDIMRAAMSEVILAACSEGVPMDDSDLDYWFGVFDKLPPNGSTSMWQDVTAQRRTEIELFAGTIIDLGKKHNFNTPVNAMLYELIRAKEKSYGVE
ncbi:MAG: ketopantoate reductase family protein [Bacillota bacterium]|jgi:2-dehydropantoate 2-reductase